MNDLADTALAHRSHVDAASLHVAFSDQPAALRFAFVDGITGAVRVGCDWLAGPRLPETWRFGEACRALVFDPVENSGGIADATQSAYTKLIAQVRGSTHPHLLRIWNYLDAINDGDGDDERYRRFCVGRAAGVDADFNATPPAATAIGHHSHGANGVGNGVCANIVQVIALCGREPAIALENPRQTPAWSYPREHGPVSPGFSRGALLDADGASPLLLASGTASIVGHVSQHAGDVAEQLRESLRNLETLLSAGSERCTRRFSLRRCQALRVYLRHPADLPLAQAVIAASLLPAARVVYLHGDVCRRELDVELEGVFAGE
ncbi:MAG: pteridine-dependent deoxygenase [Proteobacteria bacterium]|nr:pteridine-dependent deoxygenase [Pseudomonadota bacterium]